MEDCEVVSEHVPSPNFHLRVFLFFMSAVLISAVDVQNHHVPIYGNKGAKDAVGVRLSFLPSDSFPFGLKKIINLHSCTL